MDTRGLVVAVDGPAGAGKSTVARRVANALGFLFLDSGVMYRALAYEALRQGVDLTDNEALQDLLSRTDIVLRPGAGGRVEVWAGGQNITGLVRSPEVNASVSLVAGVPGIREELVRRQRQMAQDGRVVMDGRDIGTNVLPDADVKIFLTASLDERARRCQEDFARQGVHMGMDRVAEAIRHRDQLDSSRAYGPLKQAPDAVVIDTTNMEVDAVVAKILELCRQRQW